MSLNPLSYLIVRPHQLPQVHGLMYKSFHRDEPMTNHLHLCQVREYFEVLWFLKASIEIDKLYRKLNQELFWGFDLIPPTTTIFDSTQSKLRSAQMKFTSQYASEYI